MTSYRPVAPKAWPSGFDQPLLSIANEPTELGRRYGLQFVREFDDLDWYEIAALDLDSGIHVHLRRYEGNPEPGTTAYVDGALDRRLAAASVVAALGLDANDIRWIATPE